MSDVGRRIVRSTAVMMASSAAVSAVGFLKNVLAAYYFGTSGSMDAYLLALLVPDMVMYVATTGSFTFIPLFAEAKARSEQEAWSAAGKMMTYWFLLLASGLAIATLYTPELTSVLAPGFSGAQREQTIEVSRILLLMSGAVATARVVALSLYAQSKFVAGQVSETLFQVASTLYLVAFWRHGISALVWGMVFGAFVQLLVVGIALWDRRLQIRLSLDLKAPAVRKMIKLIFPVYLGNSAGQLNSVVNRAFASLLPPGAISSLQYGSMLAEGSVSLVASSLTSAIFPFLSRQYAEREDRQAQQNVLRAIGVVLLLYLPMAVGLFLLARPVVQLLLQHGSFDARSTSLTGSALRIYALGIVAMALNRVLPVAYQARQNTIVPTQAGLVRIAGNAALCALLVPRIGHLGVATAVVVSEHLKLALLLARQRTQLFAGRARAMLGFVARLLLAVLGMAVLVAVATKLLVPADARASLRAVSALLGVVGLGAAAYSAALYILYKQEFHHFSGRLRSAFPRFLGQAGPLADRQDDGLELPRLIERLGSDVAAAFPKMTPPFRFAPIGPPRRFDSCRLYRLDAVDASGQRASLAVKVFRAAAHRPYATDAALSAQYRSLEEAGRIGGLAAGVGSPRAIAMFPDLGALVMEWVEGRRLLDCLATEFSSARREALVRACGAWLREFHRLRQAPAAPAAIADKRADFSYGLRALGANGVSPELLLAVQTQASAWSAGLETLPVPTCFSHRDFSASNVMLDDHGRLIVLDIGRGEEPAPVDSDVAAFLVSLEKAALHPLRWSLTPRVARRLRRAFLDGYLGPGVDPPPLTRFEYLRLLVRTSCYYLRVHKDHALRRRWLRQFFVSRLASALDEAGRAPFLAENAVASTILPG